MKKIIVLILIMKPKFFLTFLRSYIFTALIVWLLAINVSFGQTDFFIRLADLRLYINKTTSSI